MTCNDTHTHCHSCWCNDMQRYVFYLHTLPFLLMYTLWMDTYWMDTHGMDTYELAYCMDTWRIDVCFAIYIAIPADAYFLRGYVLNGYILKRYVLNGYVLKGCVLKAYVLVGYVFKAYVLVGYVLKAYVMVGYVLSWCLYLYVRRTLRRNVFRKKKKTCWWLL